MGFNLQQDLVAAMKAKDDTRVGALRLLLAAAKNKQIDLGHELGDEEFLAVVQKEVKQRKDSISQYQAADRADLVAEEQAELAILEEYMPEQMTEDVVEAEVDKAVAAVGASGISDMGQVMAGLAHLKGQADMGMVSSLVRQKLSS